MVSSSVRRPRSSASASMAWACCSAPAEDPGRLFAGLLHGQVRGALRQDQGLAQRLVAATGVGCGRLGPLGAFDGLAESFLHGLEPGGHLFEKVVDVFGVVAAHLLAELDFTQRFRRDLHAAPC